MSGVLAICDALAAFIEPDPSKRDDARVRPAEYELDMLYLWPQREVYEPEGDGSLDLQRFQVAAAWAADRKGEGDPDRSVTDEIVAFADAMAGTIRANRTDGAIYEHAQVAFDYEALTGFDVRGVLAVITGYVLRTD